jgi:hypothetical protein
MMPALGVVDGVQNGTVEWPTHAPYYFFGKDEAFALGCAIPFGLNSRQMTAWMYQGNGLKLMREFYAKYNIVNFPMGQHRRANGRLVPQGNQVGGRHQGPENAHWWLCRQGAERMGGVPQNIPGGEIYQALEKGTIDACRVGGPLRRPEIGLQQGGTLLLLPRLVGRRSAAGLLYINQKALTACLPRTRPSYGADRVLSDRCHDHCGSGGRP